MQNNNLNSTIKDDKNDQIKSNFENPLLVNTHNVRNSHFCGNRNYSIGNTNRYHTTQKHFQTIEYVQENSIQSNVNDFKPNANRSYHNSNKFPHTSDYTPYLNKNRWYQNKGENKTNNFITDSKDRSEYVTENKSNYNCRKNKNEYCDTSNNVKPYRNDNQKYYENIGFNNDKNEYRKEVKCNPMRKTANESYTYNNMTSYTHRNNENKNSNFRIKEDNIQYKNYSKKNLVKTDVRINVKQNKLDTSKLDQREMLIYELSSSKYECMICMNVIKNEASTWSCDKCYHIFHLHCIKKWAQSGDKKDNLTTEIQYWPCPTCKNNNECIKIAKLFYLCFCNKQVNPTFKHGTTPHSCSDVCSQGSKINPKCPHLCSLQCHPGPCPPCEASVTRQCHCGRTRITARCIADETQFGCQSVCDKMMQCGLHSCKRRCHVDDGHQCQISVEQKCWCDRSTRSVVCGSEESMLERYECGVVCGRVKNCGNHSCESLCHEGECADCDTMPDKVKNCCCGKKAITELSEERHSCLDPIASCGSICGEKYQNCEHKCQNICHRGPCEPCPGTSARKCRCHATVQTVNCASNEVAVCRQRCKEKLLCGRHRCDRQCCDSEVHICVVDCGRILSCKEHRCERECGHPGLCPSCPNVSFEELFCECRSTYTLPPIACGIKAPSCRHPCSRAHTCDHPVRHNCHSESQCPPCTELVNKPCPGGHSEYANIPCFRPVATCGLPCGRPLSGCTHTCKRLCHDGPCTDTNDQRCTQPCDQPRKDCQHPCSLPCHEGPCDNDTEESCRYEVRVSCRCALRSNTVPCHQLALIASSTTAHKRYHVTETGQVSLNCDDSCARAVTRALHFRETYITADNKSSAKVAIDSTVSCALRCAATCHNGPPSTSTPTRACKSSSYGCVQRYYAAYLKDFAKYNINFVTSVENIFMGFYDHLRAKESDKCSHQFLSVTAEKSQFINRYSAAFRLVCISSKNRDGTVNVIVTADGTTYCYPSVPLSKKVNS